MLSINEQGMEMQPQEFTQGTKILLSFGSRSGGFEFSCDLRSELMGIRGWEDPCSVYLDAISAAKHPDSTTELVHVNGKEVQAYRNPKWQELYQAAMMNADAMVFIVTPEWARSNYCEEEHQWFDAIRAGKHDKRITMTKRLPIIVIAYENALSLLGKTDRIIAQGAAKVTSHLASLPASQRAVRKGIRHGDGSLIVLKKAQTAKTLVREVNAALLKVGV